MFSWLRPAMVVLMVAVVGVDRSHAQERARLNQQALQKAQALYASLSEDQKKRVGFASREEMGRWQYTPGNQLGVSLREMNTEQKKLTLNLLKLSLSAQGYKRTENIMMLEDVLGGSYSSGLYWVRLNLQPGAWQWQFQGHHLTMNFTIGDPQMTMTPTFFGANPARTSAGLRVLGTEEDDLVALFKSLSVEQKRVAIVSASVPDDIFTGPGRDEALKEPEGIAASELSDAQKALLLKAIGSYVNSLPGEAARSQMDAIRASLASTRFSWRGPEDTSLRWYARIHGPDVLIEFDQAGGTGARQNNHIHSIWRIPGRDYGVDLMREHYQDSHR